MKATIYDILKKDHKKVSELFEKLEEFRNQKEESQDKQEIEKLFKTIRDELAVHSEAEEKEFYVTVSKPASMENLILESKAEHSIFKKLLNELNENVRYDPKWFAKLHEVKELVEHHVEQEEGPLFTKAKKILNKEEEIEIGENFIKHKKKLENASKVSRH